MIGLVATAALIWWLGIDELYRTAAQLSPFHVGVAAGLSVVGIVIQAEKWHVLLVHLIPTVTRKKALTSLLAGMGLGMFTPGRIGELGRGVVFSADRGSIALLAAADRGISMAITILFGCLAFAILKMYALFFTGFFLLLFGIGTILFIRDGVKIRLGKIGERVSALFSIVPQRAWFASCLWGSLFNGVFFLQFYLLLSGDVRPSFEEGLLAPAIFAVKSLVPISFLDIGIREGVAVWLFSERGFNPVPAFNAALGMFVLNVAIPGGLGWFYVGRAALKTEVNRMNRKEVE